MNVGVSHHVDKSDQRPDGLYDFHYEYDVYDFAVGGRLLRARAYVDTPNEVSFLGWYDLEGKHVASAVATRPPAETIRYLEEKGFSTITALGSKGYEPIHGQSPGARP